VETYSLLFSLPWEVKRDKGGWKKSKGKGPGRIMRTRAILSERKGRGVQFRGVTNTKLVA